MFFMELAPLRLLTVCVQVLGLISGWEKEKNWTSVLHGNCSCNCEIDVKFFNHPNWTSIT